MGFEASTVMEFEKLHSYMEPHRSQLPDQCHFSCTAISWLKLGPVLSEISAGRLGQPFPPIDVHPGAKKRDNFDDGW